MVSTLLSSEVQHGKTRMTFSYNKLPWRYGLRCKQILLGFWIIIAWCPFDWHGTMLKYVSLFSIVTAFIFSNDCSRPTSRSMPASVTLACSFFGCRWSESSRQVSVGGFEVAHGKSDRQAPAYIDHVPADHITAAITGGAPTSVSLDNVLQQP